MLKNVSAWDLKISLWMQTQNHKPLKYVLDYVTWIGYPPQGFVFALFLFLVEKRISFYFGIVSLFAFVYLIKGLTKRPRPATIHNIRISHRMKSASFPSSHCALFTYIFGYLIYLVNIGPLPPLPALTLTFTLTILILLVGPSRVYRGEHWASDTLAGYSLGLVWLYLFL